jgi:hypothetical protein
LVLEQESEKLIAKIQVEFMSGSSIKIAMDEPDWDIGLLYFTTQNLWLINSNKEKTQISFSDIIDVDEIKSRKSKKKTKFTKVLKAKNIMNIDYRSIIDEKPTIKTVRISAAKEILNALRTQMSVRLEQKTKKKTGQLKLDKDELLRRLAVFMELDIKEDNQLKYFLGVKDRDLVNLMLERNRILQKT